MPAINASRQHGLLDLPALRKRAKRLLNALNNHQAEDAREQLRTLGLPRPRLPACRYPMAGGPRGRLCQLAKAQGTCRRRGLCRTPPRFCRR